MHRWQRIVAAPIGLGLAAGLLTGGIPAAQATVTPEVQAPAVQAPAVQLVAASKSKCVIKGFSPKTIVVGEDSVKVTVRPKLSSGCRNSVWTVKSGAFTATEDNPTVTLTPNKALLRYAGRNDVTIRARQSGSGKLVKKTYNNELRLQRNTSFEADPNAISSAPRNSTVQLQSQLNIADWADPDNEDNPNIGREYLRVQFKTNGGNYRTVKKFRYQGNGNFGVSYVNVKITRSGYWRYVFDGTSSLQASKSSGQSITATS